MNVFGDPKVKTKFKELNIAAFKADWTSQDETIAKALAGFGRNSVPLYVLYGRDPKSAPIILPEIITPKIILEALEKLKRLP